MGWCSHQEAHVEGSFPNSAPEKCFVKSLKKQSLSIANIINHTCQERTHFEDMETISLKPPFISALKSSHNHNHQVVIRLGKHWVEQNKHQLQPNNQQLPIFNIPAMLSEPVRVALYSVIPNELLQLVDCVLFFYKIVYGSELVS